MGSSDGGWFRKVSMVCLYSNAIVARGIIVTILHCGTPEPRLSATSVVISVRTSLLLQFRLNPLSSMTSFPPSSAVNLLVKASSHGNCPWRDSVAIVAARCWSLTAEPRTALSRPRIASTAASE